MNRKYHGVRSSSLLSYCYCICFVWSL